MWQMRWLLEPLLALDLAVHFGRHSMQCCTDGRVTLKRCHRARFANECVCDLHLLFSSCAAILLPDGSKARKLNGADQLPLAAETGSTPGSSSSGSNSTSTINPSDVPVDMGSAITNLFKQTFKNQTLPPLKDLFFPPGGHNHTHKKKNFTLEDWMPKNFSLKTMVKEAIGNVTNGMTAWEFTQALMTGTISSNTADTNTPDRGLADVQSGAININPFMNGAALSNALTLAGRDATANSRGLVFGMIGNGRSSSQATSLGITGAKSSTDTLSINSGGLNQNAMSANLAATPQGRADTSVRSAAFNIVGHTATGGLTTAVGKKGAAAAGLGAGMTGGCVA